MSGNLAVPAETLAAFLLVMVRLGGVMMFVPLPGLRQGPSMARIAFALILAAVMYPAWQGRYAGAVTLPGFVAALTAETAIGLAVGLCVSLLGEALTLAAQMISLQAGYSYASTIDPNTQAEAGYLVVIAQLVAALLFFGLGIDRQVLQALGESLRGTPPGALAATMPKAVELTGLLSQIFLTGLRVALPALSLLLMVDLALSIIGRINMQLQVMTMTFPVKMLVGLAVMAWTAALIPQVFLQEAGRVLRTVRALLG
jgi:flagellar biosynthetic protein FliR